MMANFNPAPILLRHPSSLNDQMILDKQQQRQQSCCVPDENNNNNMIEVPQHLNPEQVHYEFPPKSRLEQLAQYYDVDGSSFFDESSFTTTSTSTMAYLPGCESEAHPAAAVASSSQRDYSDDSLDRFFHSISSAFCRSNSNSLSPLQLPSACEHALERSRVRRQSCDSMDTVTQYNTALKHLRSRGGVVAPASFLGSPNTSIDQGYCPRVQSNEALPVFRSESELHSEDCATVIVIRLSRNKPPSTLARSRCSSKQAWSSSNDEGYVGGGELPMQSASLFLPLSDQDQEQLINNELLRKVAATKIQAAWRGYLHRKNARLQGRDQLKPTHKLMTSIISMCGSVHRRQMGVVQSRLESLNRQLHEETAMRIAFEKAIEGMTVLIDQQHRVLYERIEQEISLRERHERKMDETLARIQPLEQQLRKEVMARSEIESMMTCVLEQIHDMKREARADAEKRRKLQAQLDEARDEIARLRKQRSVTPEMRTRAAMPPHQQVSLNHKLHVGEKISVSAMAATPPKLITMTLRRTTPTITHSRVTSRLENKRSMPSLTTVTSLRR